MRSVIVSLYELNADEIFVVGHHDCGMSKIEPSKTLDKMIAAGIKPSTLSTLEYAGIDIARWLHGFDSVKESVIASASIIRNHPLVPSKVPVHALIIDPDTGECVVIFHREARIVSFRQANLLNSVPPPHLGGGVCKMKCEMTRGFPLAPAEKTLLLL